MYFYYKNHNMFQKCIKTKLSIEKKGRMGNGDITFPSNSNKLIQQYQNLSDAVKWAIYLSQIMYLSLYSIQLQFHCIEIVRICKSYLSQIKLDVFCCFFLYVVTDISKIYLSLIKIGVLLYIAIIPVAQKYCCKWI